MLLWLTEDQETAYLCTVAEDKKADLLKLLETIKGESDVVNLSKAAENKFTVTSENTRIQLKVITIVIYRANSIPTIKKLRTMLS